MNGADDCPSSLSQRLHERNDLEAGCAVQTTGIGHKKTKEADALFNLDLCWDYTHIQNRWAISYLVGSSKNMTGGLLTSSRAMASLLRWPPERELVRVWAHSWRPKAVRISSTLDTNRDECGFMMTHITDSRRGWIKSSVMAYVTLYLNIVLCCDVEHFVEITNDHQPRLLSIYRKSHEINSRSVLHEESILGSSIFIHWNYVLKLSFFIVLFISVWKCSLSWLGHSWPLKPRDFLCTDDYCGWRLPSCLQPASLGEGGRKLW